MPQKPFARLGHNRKSRPPAIGSIKSRRPGSNANPTESRLPGAALQFLHGHFSVFTECIGFQVTRVMILQRKLLEGIGLKPLKSRSQGVLGLGSRSILPPSLVFRRHTSRRRPFRLTGGRPSISPDGASLSCRPPSVSSAVEADVESSGSTFGASHGVFRGVFAMRFRSPRASVTSPSAWMPANRP